MESTGYKMCKGERKGRRMTNQPRQDTASFNISFNLPPEAITAYFDGMAKVEAAKHPPQPTPRESSDWVSVGAALLPMVLPLVTGYISSNGRSRSSKCNYKSEWGCPLAAQSVDEAVTEPKVETTASICVVNETEEAPVGSMLKNMIESVMETSKDSEEEEIDVGFIQELLKAQRKTRTEETPVASSEEKVDPEVIPESKDSATVVTDTATVVTDMKDCMKMAAPFLIEIEPMAKKLEPLMKKFSGIIGGKNADMSSAISKISTIVSAMESAVPSADPAPEEPFEPVHEE